MVVFVEEVDFLFGKMVVIYNPKEELKGDKMPAEGTKMLKLSTLDSHTSLSPGVVIRKYFKKDVV